MLALSKRWQKLWQEVGGRESHRKILFDDLMHCYREPWRTYHALPHVEAMFAEFDAFRGSEESRFVDSAAVEMSAWYHDAIYYPLAKDNEERSAELFRMVGECSGLTDHFIQKVVLGILATKHQRVSDDLTIRTLCDLDLTILGYPETSFDEYERQIRKEYVSVPEDQFRAGRSSILRMFTLRPSIYSMRFFHEKYEEQARKNLARSIARLSER